jgi:hypothetical protein
MLHYSSNLFAAFWVGVFLIGETVSGVDICSVGSYRHDKQPWRQGCPGFRLCEKGYYCNGTTKTICPSGVYGDNEGLQTPLCSGKCPAGYFCPSGTPFPRAHKCGNVTTYCPEGSSSPLIILNGYYGIGESTETYNAVLICPKGHFCTHGEKFTCPAGYYGDTEGLFTRECAGKCPAGWYCPVGTVRSTDFPCGSSTHTFCPEGSTRPTPTTLGFYTTEPQHTRGGGFSSEKRCPPGSYCIEGVRTLCPAGRFGAIHESINASCDGLCLPGWYCPAGSITPDQEACGGTDKYCPAGSATPLRVTLGYYTVGSNKDYETRNNVTENYFTNTRSGQVPCDRGFYCAADGECQQLCPYVHRSVDQNRIRFVSTHT